MEINVLHKKQGNYLLVEASGKWDWEKINKMIVAIRTKADELRCHRILFDTRNLESPKAELHRFLIGETIAREWPPPFKVAEVSRENTSSKLVENTAVNRGAIYTIFYNRKQALEWLSAKT